MLSDPEPRADGKARYACCARMCLKSVTENQVHQLRSLFHKKEHVSNRRLHLKNQVALALDLATGATKFTIGQAPVCTTAYIKALGISRELFFSVKKELMTTQQIFEQEHGNFLKERVWAEGDAFTMPCTCLFE